MIRVGVSGEQLDVPHHASGVSEGYCTTATWRVSWASSRTVRLDDVVEVDRAVEERADRPALRRR